MCPYHRVLRGFKSDILSTRSGSNKSCLLLQSISKFIYSGTQTHLWLTAWSIVLWTLRTTDSIFHNPPVLVDTSLSPMPMDPASFVCFVVVFCMKYIWFNCQVESHLIWIERRRVVVAVCICERKILNSVMDVCINACLHSEAHKKTSLKLRNRVSETCSQLKWETHTCTEWGAVLLLDQHHFLSIQRTPWGGQRWIQTEREGNGKAVFNGERIGHDNFLPCGGRHAWAA